MAMVGIGTANSDIRDILYLVVRYLTPIPERCIYYRDLISNRSTTGSKIVVETRCSGATSD